MNPIRTLIVDDEPLAREGIRLLLQDQPDFNVVGECGNGAQAVNYLNHHPVDLLFIDVQMPEMNGFEVLSNIRPVHMPVIVFVTAFDQYALEAFRVHAMDYLLKPYSDERFYKILDRVRASIEHKNFKELSDRLIKLLSQYGQGGMEKMNLAAPSKYLSRIPVSSGGKIIFIKTADVEWIEAADYYVEIHTNDNSYLLRETMNHLEEQLDPDRFFRIHRSTIVPLEHIHELEPYFNGEYFIVLDNGRKFKLSKSRYDNLKSRLNLSS
jgi:two-component system, LytTR family, response regulator